MKNTETTFDQAPNQNWIPEFPQTPGLNTTPIDYNLLINKQDSSSSQYYATYIQCTAGATADWTFREISVGANWDVWIVYSQTILIWLWSTTATVTRTSTITQTGNVFTLQPGKVMEITARLPTATGILRADFSWSMNLLMWTSFDLSQTNSHIAILNVNTSSKDITMKFATSAADRPTLWYFIRIY